ncbi:cellulase family glycosylhydrolase [Jutongia sp.]
MALRKKAMAIVLSMAMVATSLSLPNMTAKTAQAAGSSFQNLNQSQITEAMGVGYNLGNSLEAASSGTPNETAYGNPKLTEDLVLAAKDAGFKSIRIPVSYLSMIDDNNGYKIDSSWLDRVQQVVDYCVDNDMYAIVNMHGDGYTTVNGGWLLCGSGNQTQIKAKYKACWEQIADRFKNYDEHLIFESMNEEFDGTYGTPSRTAYANINAYNQIFVDTVRKSGGNNNQRWLLIPGWNTNIDYTAGDYGFEMPTDNYLSSNIASGQKRIMISVHYYDPWDFCGTESGATTQWGDSVTDASKKASWGDESYMVSQFKKMYTKFVSQGYPVVIGEFGAINKENYDSQNKTCRAEYYQKVCYYAKQYGMIPVAWDNGYNGDYGFAIIDRYSNKVVHQELMDAMMEVYGGNESATATGITLSQSSMTIHIGDEKQQLTATLTPADSKDKVLWSSSDEAVATVNSKGQVTAVGAGTCTITASVPLGYKATCEVTVPQANYVRAKMYLLETASWQSVISDEYVDIYSDGGDFSLSLDATKSQLQNIGSLYIKDINAADDEASVFDKATIKVKSFEINGQKYTMKNDTFTYDVSQKASDDGLICPIFNFSFINVWANTHVNNVTVENANYKAYFNNVNYQTVNSVKMNFTVSGINGSDAKPTAAPTVAPTKAPTAKPTAAPTVVPTKAPTAKPTVAPTVAPTKAPTAAPTQAPGTTGKKVIASNLTSTYATNDPSWLMNASDDDIVTVVYTCTDPSHANWGILGWGASVDNTWQNGDNYSAASNATEEVTKVYTVKELKNTLNIKTNSSVTYLCLSVWNGGKIVSLSIASTDGETPEPTVAPTEAPTVAPTVAPTEAPTAAPTIAPTVAPTVAPTAAPTTAPTTTPAGDSKVTGSVKLTSNWGSGGIAQITLTNETGVSYTNGWTVEFTLDREITSMWSGECVSLGNNRYRISNPGWDGNWAAGKTITLNCGVGAGSDSPVITDIVMK